MYNRPVITKGCDNKEYLVTDNTWYHKETPLEVIKILEDCRNSYRQYRLRIFYGDMETGKAWIDPEYCTNESDIRSSGEVGYIGRSTGKVKIPLSICKSNSMGGGGILTHCIVKIETSIGKIVLYQHKNFHLKGE